MLSEYSQEVISAMKIINDNGGTAEIIGKGKSKRGVKVEQRFLFHPYPGIKILGKIDLLVKYAGFVLVKQARDLKNFG